MISNAKWQMLSDKMLLDLGFFKPSLIPQLFFIVQNSRVVVICSKIVDDLLLTSLLGLTDVLTERINERFLLGTVTTRPGQLHFYGLDMFQSDDYSISMDADD